MRTSLVLAFASLFVLVRAGSLLADDAGPAGIIDKAIKATGGEDKIKKFKTHTWKVKGTYHGMGNPIEFTGTYAVDWPDKFRAEIEGYAIIVLNGDKGWMQTMGETKEMDAEQLAEQKESNYAGYVATLLPLKDKAYTLTPLGEVKVGDRPAVGVKVSSKGHRHVELYFDKDTNLLIKSQTRVKSREQEGKEMDQESLYADYKEMDGAKVPMKVTINREGKVYVESESTDVKPVDKLDDSTFGKP